MDINEIDLLNNYLLEINNKYQSTNLLDLDFCILFKLNYLESSEINNKSILRKKITNSYYKLALKFHPDKFKDNNTEYISINDVYIKSDYVKNGLLLSFINDIYNMILDLLENQIEILINLINKSDIKATNEAKNFIDLKEQQNIPISNKISGNDIINFRNELKKINIDEKKIGDDEIVNLINDLIKTRNNLNIEKTIKNYDNNNFNEIFNNDFIENKLKKYKLAKNNEIMPFNFSHNYIIKRNNVNITDIDEAFKVLEIDYNYKIKLSKNIDELQNTRKNDEKNFKYI